MNFIFILVGLLLLILGGNWLLKSAVSISLKLQIPKIIIGMTVVSFATSAPELIVSIKAALDGFSDLSLGNVIGSNIANIGLVLAVTLLVSRIDVQKSFYFTDWPLMMIATILFTCFILNDETISRVEGFIFFVVLIAFIVYLFRYQKQAVVEEISNDDEALPNYKIMLLLLIGGFGLWSGSELLIKGSVDLAKDFGVSERLIAVTVVSVGTSIPELSASIIAVFKKEKAISLGNLIGSNMFNILAVLGITAMISPISVKDETLLSHDLFWMIGISILILPLVLIPKNLRLDWKDGLVLIVCYGIFIYTTIA